MATVPELIEQAKALGIKRYSKMRKPELIDAIAKFHASDDTELDSYTAEELSNKINEATPTATPQAEVTRAERASQAGSRGKSALPLTSEDRRFNYRWQNAKRGGPSLADVSLTPAQSRRDRKKSNKALGFNGCTIKEYRIVRRKLKKLNAS